MSDITDIVERLRKDGTSWAQGLFDEAADEIERLTEQLKLAVWTDSEHCKLVEADNELLREALKDIADMRYDNTSAATIAQTAISAPRTATERKTPDRTTIRR